MNNHEFIAYNRDAWNRQVRELNRWTVPVSPEEIARARADQWSILLTPKTPVPRDWFPPLRGLDVLLLAGGGGQQSAILAALGANVTVADLSREQLNQDLATAKREGFEINAVCCDAAEVPLLDDSFDLIVNPASICFFPEVRPVWRECGRLLRSKGVLMTGFIQPVAYCFDFEKANRGDYQLKYKLPYSDTESLSESDRKRFLHPGHPIEKSHTLTDIIGGIIDAGFVVDRFMEDEWEPFDGLNKFFPAFLAVRAQRAT